MSRPKTKLSEGDLVKAKRELEKIKNSKLALKLKAIISYSNLPAKRVAEVLQVSRSTIHIWVNKFVSGGIDELRDKPKGHYPAKLKKEHKNAIKHWLESSKTSDGRPVHWTLKLLQHEIKKVFDIKISQTQIWYTLKDLDFAVKSPRPQHHKADKKAQEEFKKK